LYNPSAEIRGRVYCKRDDRHTDSRQTRQYHAGPGTKSQLCKIPGSGCGILCVASTSIPEQRRDVTRNMTQDKDQEERKRLAETSRQDNHSCPAVLYNPLNVTICILHLRRSLVLASSIATRVADSSSICCGGICTW
jgi:hypothetical protein